MSPLALLNGEIEPLDPKLSETSPKKGPGSVENTIRRNRIRGSLNSQWDPVDAQGCGLGMSQVSYSTEKLGLTP